jgi:hypothetical protein
MKSKTNWSLVGFFVVAATLPFAAFVHDFVFDRCGPTILAEVAKEKPSFGCFEFWLNRYQTMLAALIGAAVAIVVVRPVFVQLREMSRQTSKGAKEIAESFALAIDEEIEAIEQIHRAVEFYILLLYDFEMHETVVDPSIVDESQRMTEDIRKWLIPVNRNGRRQIATITINDMRYQYLGALRQFSNKASEYVIHLRIMSQSMTKSPSRIASAAKAASAGKSKIKELREASETLLGALIGLSDGKWAQVRELERKAQGIED